MFEGYGYWDFFNIWNNAVYGYDRCEKSKAYLVKGNKMKNIFVLVALLLSINVYASYVPSGSEVYTSDMLDGINYEDVFIDNDTGHNMRVELNVDYDSSANITVYDITADSDMRYSVSDQFYADVLTSVGGYVGAEGDATIMGYYETALSDISSWSSPITNLDYALDDMTLDHDTDGTFNVYDQDYTYVPEPSSLFIIAGGWIAGRIFRRNNIK